MWQYALGAEAQPKLSNCLPMETDWVDYLLMFTGQDNYSTLFASVLRGPPLVLMYTNQRSTLVFGILDLTLPYVPCVFLWGDGSALGPFSPCG